MAGNPAHETIIRYEMNHAAPTGEGERFVADTGRVWKPASLGDNRQQTGVMLGSKLGNTIVPKN